MKIKSIVTALFVAGTFGAGAATVTQEGMLNRLAEAGKLSQSTTVKQIEVKKQKTKYRSIAEKSAQIKYFEEHKHEGKKRYIVRLVDDPVTSYKGDVVGLAATNLSARKNGFNNHPFDADSVQAKKYASYLEQKQQSLISKVSSSLGFNMPSIRSYKYAINGMLTELTYRQAQALGKMKEVTFVEQEQNMQLDTDTGPLLIGAGEVWNGTAVGTEYMGEGVVIGMIDTGINTDHRSFAATGDDGYTVVNPLGDGVYKGDCIADSSLCNSKLIGVYSYSDITDAYADPLFTGDTRPANGEDHNGHGSHTASTAGGNVIDNVPFVVNDAAGGNTGDGLATTYIYPRMSGVAPHANIIAYQVCWPGNTGDTYVACPSSVTVQAIDDAIADGVDVINYSIGHDPSAWTSAVESGFLSAQAAGIFVATSAGNSGPGPATTSASAPWYTSVAASTHGNADVAGDSMTLGTLTGGDTTAPADITGIGLNGTFTGDMVWAGDFTNANDPSGDPAQCLEPFPAGTFTASQIVVCDRGAIARVQKAVNAAAGGAGGFVLANIQGGSDTLPGDYYSIPGIHINAADGDVLRTWLASGTGHQGTISAAVLTRTTNTADEIASFSSRGPNQLIDLVSPQITAPGHRIYAAWADDQPFMDVTTPSPMDFITISGTSMASPHMAGAGALVTQAQPTWNPDQIRSALMMTSTMAVTKDAGVDANFWDMGAGRVQVNQAVNAGLVMSESEANYLAADPATGGDPKTLNVPSMANYSCAGACSWTRTFNIVADGTYTVTTSSELLTSDTASFTAVAGDNVTVVFSLDVTSLNTDTSVFETVSITSAGQPDLHLPVFALVNNGAVPDEVNISAGRDNGSWTVEGIQTIPTDDLNFSIDGLFDANAVGFSATEDFELAQDPTNDFYDDDLSQVYVLEFDVPANAVSLNAAITETTAPDNDLFLEIDSGGGSYQLVAFSATGATLESIALAEPDEGHYRVIVQNWAGSAAPTDTGTLEVNVVPRTDPVEGLSVTAPTTADGDVAASLNWDIPMAPGDSYYADVTVLAGTTEIGTFRATLDRVTDDFSSSADQTLVSRGEQIDYTVTINPTVYNQDVDYSVSIDMPPHMSLVEGSAASTGGGVTVKDPNAVGLDLTSDFDIPEDPDNTDYRDDLSVVYVYEFEVPDGTLSLTAAISDSTSPDNDLFVEYDSIGDGSFDTLVAFAATGAANEVATAGSPKAGMYRAIVQNWAGSGAATDTGSLRITTVPATGEGLIWSINAPGIKPLYSVVSSANDADCANAGFGGYLGLSNFGFPTLGFAGDTVAGTLFNGTNTFPFYGEVRTNGITITDDGFAIFSGTPGASPWANTSLPNVSEPNDMIAMLWKDMEIIDDGVRGVRVYQDPDAGFSYIDFEGMQGWGLDSERLSYALFAWESVADDRFEYIVSYSSSQTGDLTPATSGVENADGTIGTDASSMIEPGVQLCYNYNAPPQAHEITFSVVPEAQYLGATAAPKVTVESSMEGTKDLEFRAAPVELVNVAPTANAGSDVTYDRADAPTQVLLSGAATLDLDEDVLSYKWTQISGKTVDLHSSGTIQAFFNFNEVKNGSYTFQLDVSDGEFSSTDEVTITIEGKEANSGSLGVFILLLIGIPILARRKRLK